MICTINLNIVIIKLKYYVKRVIIMEGKLGRIVHDGKIYDLDDIKETDKLEKLLESLESEEKKIKDEIEKNINDDLEEK